MRGAFLPVGVGRGKSLISLLAPVVMKAERPVLFVPARLRDQTHRLLPELGKQWRLHPDLRIIGYSELSLEKNADMLDRLDPDLIILDECHRARARTSARTRRLMRWFRIHPETRCVAMSGTVTKRSIRDYAHILRWCLGDQLSPLPVHWRELCDWADALDADIPEDSRVAPGALAEFRTGDETVREAYGRRLTETPGVINSVGEDGVDASLVVARWPVTVPDVMYGHLERLRKRWETPNGDTVAEAVDLWRHARELALGFFYRWDHPAPFDWFEARREWKKYVRDVIKHNRRGIDTELQVWRESERDSGSIWQTWCDIKNSFKPNLVAEWLSEDIIRAAAQWLDENGGIVWVEHIAVGKRVAELSDTPYFGAGDDAILDHKGPCVVSMRAHGEGKNLQRWSRCLVLAPPPAGDVWEQLLGRTHRAGQAADEVIYEVYLGCQELRDGFDRARADAVYLEQTLGARQKMNYCTVEI